MLEENTQYIASALRMAIINLDMIPRIVYQDNGKAFKAKYFSKSTDFTESGFNGIYTKLGIKPVYAKPYNARAKVIERFFREFQEEFEKLLPTYSGSSIEARPAHMKRNEKFHKELYGRINQGYIPTIEETIRLINCWLDYRHCQPCPNSPTQSIKQVFEGRIRQNIAKNELDELMMAHEIKTIHRNGIRFLNTDYYNDALYGLKDRIMIRYSLFDLRKIKVYSTRGEYLCTAKRITGTHPMAYHEIDYLAGDQKTIETIRDIHDKTNVPVIFVGMTLAQKKLQRYKHLYDRLSGIVQFKSFSVSDVQEIISQLCEIEVSEPAVGLIHNQANRFRQIVRIINRLESIAKTNNIELIDENILKEILKNESRQDFKDNKGVKQVLSR